MKKIIYILVFLNILNLLFAEEKKGTINIIDQKIQERLKEIERAKGKKLFFEKEIKKEDILKKDTKELEKKLGTQENEMINLTILNITAGIFEGAIIGTGCGLIGYSQSKNKNTTPLISGAISGSITGAFLASVLSLFEYGTKKYYASDDFGLNLLYYSLLGGILGGAGGVISYGKTDDTENISEGIGYGIAIGAFCGFVISLIEVFSSEKIMQRKFESESKETAFNIYYNNENIIAFYKIKY